MLQEKILVVLVNYHQWELTLDCIESLNRGSVIPDILIVDNEAEGDVPPEIKKYTNVSLIENAENSGFAKGNNLGIQYGLEHDYEYLLMLNNDTVVDHQMVAFLLGKANKRRITVPKMYYASQPERLWYAGGTLNLLKGMGEHTGQDQIDRGQYDEEIMIDYATGCCMLIHRNIVEQVGMLDETLFMYCEDYDYCLRVKNAGITIQYVPQAKLWHKVGASSGGERSKEAIYYGNRNRFYLLQKYHRSIYYCWYTYITRIIQYIWGCLKKNNYRYIWKAYWDYRNGAMGARKIR